VEAAIAKEANDAIRNGEDDVRERLKRVRELEEAA
jgi:hypothetical protein